MNQTEYKKINREQQEYVNCIERYIPGEQRFYSAVCCSEVKTTRGIRLRHGKQIKLVWPEHLLEQYKRFMRACNPKFYNCVKDATLENQLEICLDIPNGPTRFQCWCLWRCLWEMPRVASAMLYLWTSKGKDPRLTPQMIQVVVAGIVGNWNHYMFINCIPKSLNDLLSKLKCPPKVKEGNHFSAADLFSPDINFESLRIPSINYLNKNAVSKLITKLGG